MKRIYIHIGLHKTATTFFQEKVFPHLSNTTFITRPYTQHNHAFNKLQYADDSLYDKNEVLKELSKTNSSRILFSDESFSGKVLNFSYINRSIVGKRLKELFPQAKIILFIRGQKDILFSHYNQYIKMNGYKAINKFFWCPAKNYTYETYLNSKRYDLNTLYFNTNDFYIHLDCFLYYELISFYKSLFANVEIFLYEDLKYKFNYVIERLENIIEDKMPEDVKRKLNLGEEVNKSIALNELYTRRYINRLIFFRGARFIAKGIGMVYKIFPNKLKGSFEGSFEKSHIEKIAENYYTDNNRKVIEHYPDINLTEYAAHYPI